MVVKIRQDEDDGAESDWWRMNQGQTRIGPNVVAKVSNKLNLIGRNGKSCRSFDKAINGT